MTWDDVEDVLYDGADNDIKSLKCPDCGSLIHYQYNEETNSLKYGCKKCGIVVRGHKCSKKPNSSYCEN